MRGYSTMSDEEKNSILQQHSAFYNGYATGNIPSGPQPLLQDEGPTDSQGITVNNRGEVGQYRNHLVNESVVNEEEKDWIQNVDMDEGSFTEYCKGEVTCDCVEKAQKEGGKPSKQAQLYLNMNSDKCKSLQEEVKEYAADDMDVSDVEAAYDFESGGPDQFGDEDMAYSEDSYGMDIDSIMSMFDGSITADYDDEVPAYQFDSEGAMDTDLYEGADENDNGTISKDELHKHFDEDGDGKVTPDEYDDHIKSHLDEKETCEQCGSEMKEGECLECGSGSMYEGEVMEKETCEQCGSEMREGECLECGSGSMYEEIDEDLKESFIEDKERITEMFNRFKKFL